MAVDVVAVRDDDLYTSATSSPVATMPSGIASGNLLLTQLNFEGGSGESITPPSGWTLYNRVNNGASGHFIAIFYRVADGSESSTYTYTLGSSRVGSIQTLRITGHDSTWEDASPTSRSATTDVIIATGLTTVTNDAFCLIFTGTNSSGSTVPTEPSGWATESVAPGTGSGRTWRIVSKTFPTAGAISDVSFPTMSGTRQWCSSMVAIRPSSGTQHNQSVAGSLTSAGAITRRPAKLPAGSLTSAGAITRRTASTKAGTLTSAGTATKRTSKGIAGTLSSAGALSAIRTVLMAIAGALGMGGALSKRTATTEAGTLTSSGAATKQTRRSVAGTLSSSAMLNSIRTFLRTVAGTLGMSGAATKQTRSTKAGALVSAGDITKQTHTTTSGVLGSSGALARARTALMALAGTLSLSGAATKHTSTSTGGVLASSGSITKRISRTVAGVLGMLGDAIGALLAGNRVSTDLVMRDEPDLIMRDEPALTVASELPLRMR